MFEYFSSPSKKESPFSTTESVATTSATTTGPTTAFTPEQTNHRHRQHQSSIASQASMSSSASNSPIPSEVVTSLHHSVVDEIAEASPTFLQSVQSPPYVSSHPGVAPTVAPEPTPRRISFQHDSGRIVSSNSASYFEDVQQGFLDPTRGDSCGKRPSTPKTLFSSSNTDNSTMNSDSSNEDLPLMMTMMINSSSSSCNPQRHHHHKSRRKSRSYRRSSSNSSSPNNSSSLSHSLLLDGYDEGSNSMRSPPPLAVRRRSSQHDMKRTSSLCSTHSGNDRPLVPPPIALVSPSNSDCYVDHRRNSYTYQHGRPRSQHDLSSSSPELSSESSPDSSPHRFHLQDSSKQPLPPPQRFGRKQGSISSTSRISGNASDPSCVSNHCVTGGGGGGNSSGSILSIKSLFGSPRNKWSTKSWCLTGTFAGMILISMIGMIMLTNQASFMVVYDLKEQTINRPDVYPSAAGLRGKMVQGKWDDKPLPSTVNTKMPTKKSSSIVVPESKTTKQQPMDTEKKPRKQKKSSASAAPPSKNTGSSTVQMPVSKLPSRLKMQMPPPLSLPEAKFEITDPNMYGAASLAKKDDGEDTNQSLEKHPRVFMFDSAVSQVERKIRLYPSDFTDNTQLYGILPSDDERLSRMEIRAPYSEGECVPMQEWQTTFHPYCNGMHELALEALGADLNRDISDPFEKLLAGTDAQIFGTHGFWRYAWKLTMGHLTKAKAERDTVVLKTLKYEHNFEDAHFEHDRVDAVAMERLTSSPHVINIFGFCGHSVLTEYADGTRVGALADKARKKPLERLKIARDIAHGLADVHGIDGDGNATFVHLDVNPANVVSIGGTLKLNDFNIGIIRQWNTPSNEPCGFPAQYPNPQWRSPEEARNEQNLTEKVDIFSMGHIFFRLICGHEPWNKLEPGGKPSKEEINQKVQQGKLPFIPDHVKKSENPEVIAIRDAMLSCYQPNPKDRPSARDIAKALDAALKKLSQNPPAAEED
ncbi:Ser/Thr protein kinase [Nitzschia inconspicua]|uniref:Ser/Thr protein kinase n=1 Tax=Nitzschia inconspicua TaxID=303405 RepID=A0A9K3LRE0_9STRA|nr:Ser/Thr protein kinase [Nitzschia inconspicua]